MMPILHRFGRERASFILAKVQQLSRQGILKMGLRLCTQMGNRTQAFGVATGLETQTPRFKIDETAV